MAQRHPSAASVREAAESPNSPQAVPPLLPPKAEVALREAGLWTEEFVRQLPRLDRATLDALSVLGAWDELDWDETEAALYEIRHRNPPAPPIDFPW
jgi:hypothetical protein